MSTPYQQNAKTPAGPIASTPAGAVWGGFRGLLKKYAGAAAGYSLRKIGSGPVVRLRRASDNAEKDFAAGDLTGFSEGAELVTNGGFDTDTDWTKSANWTITGGQAVSDGTVSFGGLRQDFSENLTAGDYYILSFDIVACSDFDGLGLQIEGTSVGTGTRSVGTGMEVNSTGSHSVLFLAGAQGVNFAWYTTTGTTATIDNISFKPYTPTAAELWAVAGVTLQSRFAKTTGQSAYATTWYDQSGSGNDATQTTAAAQPLLIRAGVTNTENGKAALSFDGLDDEFTTAYDPSTTTNSIFGVVTAGSTSSDALWVQLVNSTAGDGVSMGQGGLGTAAEWGLRLYEGSDIDTSGIAMTADQTLLTGLTIAATSAQIYANGVAGALSTSARIVVGSDTAIGSAGGSRYFAGNVQETVFYELDQSANRIGIEGNINDHYGIY